MSIAYFEKISKQLQFVLASQSPQRKQVLESLGLSFKIVPSDFDEQSIDKAKFPKGELYVMENAKQKGRSVHVLGQNWLTISSDTVIVYEEKIVEKPKDREDAVRMLMELENNTHEVYTGCCLMMDNGEETRENCFYEKTMVTMGNVEKDAILDYVDTGKPMDKAGAYGIQDVECSMFIKSIQGDYHTVLGFPAYRFAKEVKKMLNQE